MTGFYVVVSGASGSGKTTLAPLLAAELGLPLISKDTIKEALANVLGLGDIEWSRRLGAAAFEALFALAAQAPAAVLETRWYPEPCSTKLAALGKPLVEVFCRCPVEVVRGRVATRVATRHPIHHDAIAPGLVDGFAADAENSRPLGLGPVLIVDTEGPTVITEIADRVRAEVNVLIQAATHSQTSA